VELGLPSAMMPEPALPGGGPRAGDADEPGGSFRLRLFDGSGPCSEGSRRCAEEGDWGICGGYPWYC
jgi:hypothetical protein